MKEIVVISGKGGTGKTSVTASFAALAGNAVLADCDVNAADLHLLLRPQFIRRETFMCGHEAVIRAADCIGCGACQAQCRFDAIRRVSGPEGRTVFQIVSVGCEGCGVCVRACPVQAIDFPERTAGEWFVSDTRYGPLAHARLQPGGENSGKLVALVREQSRKLAQAKGAELILVDGPPGIGCPVIATITGASLVVVVTEPTLSGTHDLERVLGLARHFKIPAMVCVNKWDINPAQTLAIKEYARQMGARVCGHIRYDRSVVQAQLQGCTPMELPANQAAEDIRHIWAEIHQGN